MHWWWDLFHERHRKRHRHPRHKIHFVVLFTVNHMSFVLKPDEEIFLMTDTTVGKTLNLSIGFLDADGNSMIVTPMPDSPPIWSNTTPATTTLTPSADGLTATDLAVGVGTDSIGAAATVGGVTFSATLIVNVAAKPQILTSITITATEAP